MPGRSPEAVAGFQGVVDKQYLRRRTHHLLDQQWGEAPMIGHHHWSGAMTCSRVVCPFWIQAVSSGRMVCSIAPAQPITSRSSTAAVRQYRILPTTSSCLWLPLAIIQDYSSRSVPMGTYHTGLASGKNQQSWEVALCFRTLLSP